MKLKATEEHVYISILDNGKGIPENVLTKIKSNIKVTEGKKDGHGIGLTVVKDMLKNNFGSITIASSTQKIGHGTTVEVIFPRVTAPNWLTTEINIVANDTIIILDNDIAIHNAWANKFSHILEKIPSIQVKYFTLGNDVINFVNSLPEAQKHKLCLFTNYKLNEENLNGLQLIAKCQIKRSVLVTHDFIHPEIRSSAVQNRAKILPKELINVFTCKILQRYKKNKPVNVHMIFVDDEKDVTKALIDEYYNHLIIDQYSNPLEFLDCVLKYPRDTRIILDNYYYMEDGGTYEIDGITIAKQLYDKGYANLFLLSGQTFVVPDYLTLILKTDREKVRNLDKLQKL